jgi:hypothetical protein
MTKQRFIFWLWITLALGWLVVTIPISGLIWADLRFLAGGLPTMGFDQSPAVTPIWKLFVLLCAPPALVASGAVAYQRLKQYRRSK